MPAAQPIPPLPAFLDVPVLLEQSQPRPRGAVLRYAAAMFLLLVLISAYASAQSPQLAGLVNLFSSFLMLALLVTMMGVTWSAVRKHREEQMRLEGIDELIQLRRWEQAAGLLQEMLSSPTRAPQTRVQALIYLVAVLARYHRFGDAIAVQDHLLQTIPLDPGTQYGLRLGRAMAMLHEDHLFDADRAMSELRRLPGAGESGGLALVEMYRDVKTGHPAEAIEVFESRLPAIRQQLGHRVADAYALAARAYDLLGRDEEARQAWERATLLAPAEELTRRYREVVPVGEKYPATSAPA